tara:strand:+ start:17815 stop:18588 length:774 start_codon:yes stop_codon:yes gene_type:complete
MIFMLQGKKRAVLEGVTYSYNEGHFLAALAPIPMACEIIQASPTKPLLAVGVTFERQRAMKMMMKMERVESLPPMPDEIDPSSLFTATLYDNDAMLDALIRLVKVMDCPVESAIMGDAILDEIYFRILKHERSGSLPYLLQQRGQISQIARAIDYVHNHLSEAVSINELAQLVNMSHSSFHKRFKEVMHLSPLQYTKQVKLNRAKAYILEGMNVSEAGNLVGYNSSAQFSREYKRHFGVVPSSDRASRQMQHPSSTI